MEPLPSTARRLGPDAIAPFLSPYLTAGRRAETWAIREVEIDGDRLHAVVAMTSTFVSPTDAGGFHLTAFSTLEFVSQLVLIHAHVWAGLDRKTREGWLLETSIRTANAIRDPDHIDVGLVTKAIRKIGESILGNFEFTVSDRQGGSFTGRLKAFLA